LADVAPQSPRWWLEKLYAELSNRQATMNLMNRYYTGDHPLPFLTRAHEAKMRNEFVKLLRDSRSNFMRLVVDVVEERLKVDGFRLSAATDPQADQASWDIWQANQMDSESQTAFVESLVKGVSYLSVWPGERKDDYPSIAVEDGLQTIVGYLPGSNYRKRAAALKVWRDDWTGMDRANVYLPDGIHKFEASADGGEVEHAAVSGSQNTFGGVQTPVKYSSSTVSTARSWAELEDEFAANPFEEVPIVPLRNRSRLLCEGESELADVYRVQDQINGFLFLLALAGYFGAHRQRYVAGIKLMDGPNGKPMEPFDSAIDRLWASENPAATFGEFAQTDLSGYISAVEQKVLHIAVTTRTPRHYLIEQGQSPSGDAIKSAESGLVKKVERKMRTFGEGLEEALRLARKFQGEKEPPVDSEIVWADAEVRTEAEVTDAAIKRFQGGITPWQQTMQDLGYSQTEIARMLEMFGGVAPTPASVNPPPATVPGEVQTV
jgi:hypothetical protein